MQPNSRTLASLFLVMCLTWAVHAWAGPQIFMLDHPDRIQFSSFASALAIVGDIDGDQIPDYVVGAYNQPAGGNAHQGRAFVFSGRTNKPLFTLDNPFPQPHAAFGFSVAAAGDVNQDGVPDLLVGAFGQGEGGSALALVIGGSNVQGGLQNVTKLVSSGQAFVFSGKDGRHLYALEAPQQHAGAGFGWSVASLGDVTADGIPELVVGAQGQDGAGRVFVFDGHDGRLLRTLAPPVATEQAGFGWSVAKAGDIDQDGLTDILVGAPYSTVDGRSVQGRVYVFSAKDGTVLLTLDDPQPQAGASFGWCVRPAGDLNKDGIPDVLIGAPYQDVGANAAQGAVFAYSGKDGAVLLTLHDPVSRPQAGFGWYLAASADVNTDGIPEILVGAPFQRVDEFHVQGEVFLYNGRDGRHLITFDNPYPHQGSMFGYTLASPGDTNGDDIPEFVFGTPGQHLRGTVAGGRVFSFVSAR